MLDQPLILLLLVLLVPAASWLAYLGGRRLSSGPRRCWTCRSFDVDLGQVSLRQHAPFWAAAQHLLPAQMAHGDGAKVGYPAWAKWSQFGACTHPKRTAGEGGIGLQWGGDVCPEHRFVRDSTLVRRLRYEDETRGGVA